MLRLAEMYGTNLDGVRMISNPMDLRTINKYHPLVENLIKKYKLLEADIIDVYPMSSTRFQGKQIDKAIKIIANLKKRGQNVRFICPNAHANAVREKKAIDDILLQAEEQGLTREEVIFTSLEGQEYELGVPREVVTQLFSLSNLFVFPSLSENCPLILLEAAANRCLLILNDDFPALKDFFHENALYFKFSSLLQQTSYADENGWYAEVAKVILGELNKNKPLNSFKELKQRFNRNYILKHQLEPIIFEKWE